MTAVWQNRIVGYVDVDPAELLPNALNWRTHPPEQLEALEAIFSEVGLVQNVIRNVNTGKLVDGHARVLLAVKHGQPLVPVTQVDLTLEEERKILSSLDYLASMAGVDKEKIAELHKSFAFESEALRVMLADIAEIAGVGSTEFEPLSTDAEYLPNPMLDRVYETRKQMSVLMSMAEHAQFMTAVTALKKHYNIDTMNELLVAVFTDAAATIPEPTVGPPREKKRKTKTVLTVDDIPVQRIDVEPAEISVEELISL